MDARDATLEQLLKAAEKGNTTAQYELASRYERGEGAAKDYVLAYMWYDVANALGNESLSDLGRLERDAMSRDMVGEAQKLCREWLERNGRTAGPAAAP